MSLWLTAQGEFKATTIIDIFTSTPEAGFELVQQLNKVLSNIAIDQDRYDVTRVDEHLIELKTNSEGLAAASEDGIADGVEEFLNRKKDDTKFCFTRINVGA